MPLYLPSTVGPTPPVNGLTLWNFPPETASAATTLSGGKVYLLALQVPVAQTITNLVVYVTTGAVTGTAGQNFAGLYNTAGTRVAVTGDQTTPWASVGTATMALTAPYAAAATSYYVALVANASGSLMAVAAASPSGQVANAGLPAAPWRFSSGLSGQTSLPSSLTPSAFSAEFPLWCGAS